MGIQAAYIGADLGLTGEVLREGDNIWRSSTLKRSLHILLGSDDEPGWKFWLGIL